MKSARATRLMLVRHGEVDANRSYAYLGRRDDELNATGLEQARALAVALTELRLDRIVSSPLRRAVSTAAAIAERTGVAVDVDDRLIELDFGSWEGRSRTEVVASGEDERRSVERWEADPSLPVPGGESLDQLQARVVDWANQTAGDHRGSTVLMVSHMGPIKTLLCAALGLPLALSRRIFLDPATVSVIDWGEIPVVRLVNGHGHLGFSQARWIRDAET
jgi:broad specificity phosphatase PhoE